MKTKLILITLVLMLFPRPHCMASLPEFSFILQADRSYVRVGETIEVAMIIRNNQGTAYDMYSMQNYVCFDPEYFRLEEDTVWVFGDSSGKKLFQATARKFGGDILNRIFISRLSLNGVSFDSETVVLIFRLRAVKSGITALTNDSIEMLRGLTKCSVEGISSAVEIGEISIETDDIVVNEVGGRNEATISYKLKNHGDNDVQGKMWLGVYGDGRMFYNIFEDVIVQGNSEILVGPYVFSFAEGYEGWTEFKASIWGNVDLKPLLQATCEQILIDD